MRGLWPIPLLVVVTLQVAATSPVRIGPSGNHFNADDVEQIGRICAADGKAAWVLVGRAPGNWVLRDDLWYADAYLSPDDTTPTLRRGRIRNVLATLPARAVFTEPRKWQGGELRDWAQVPVPGSNPDEVRSGRDLNRPFETFGSLDDDALVEIVSLIRSGPVISPAPSRWTVPGRPVPRELTHVESTWPIDVVVADDPFRRGQTYVRLLSPQVDERYGQTVRLRKEGSKWVVVSLGTFTLD